MTGDMKGSHIAAKRLGFQWQFVLSARGFHQISVTHTQKLKHFVPAVKKGANYREQWLQRHEVREEYACELIIFTLKWTAEALCESTIDSQLLGVFLEDNPIREAIFPPSCLTCRSIQFTVQLPSDDKCSPVRARCNCGSQGAGTGRWRKMYGAGEESPAIYSGVHLD